MMIPIVSEQDIINTYSAEDQRSCQKYAEYLQLVKANPKIGYKKAAKILGVRQGSTRWWHTKGKKQAIPNPIKAARKLEQYGLLPFSAGHPEFNNVLRMMGVIYGDGCLDCNLNTLSFISSDFADIETWKRDFFRIFPFATDKINIIEGGEFGHSYCIRTFDRSIIRFFVALGTPVGDKVTINYRLPIWLSKSSKESRVAFLDGYLSSEVSVVRYRPDSLRNSRFTDFAIGLSKIEFLEKEHREFLRSVEALLASVGISTTGNINKNYSAGRHRKDGAFTANYRIFLRTTFHRVLFFDKQFPLRYAEDKKRRFQSVIEGALKDKASSSSKFPSQKQNLFNRLEDSNGIDDLSSIPNLGKTSYEDLQALFARARI